MTSGDSKVIFWKVAKNSFFVWSFTSPCLPINDQSWTHANMGTRHYHNTDRWADIVITLTGGLTLLWHWQMGWHFYDTDRWADIDTEAASNNRYGEGEGLDERWVVFLSKYKKFCVNSNTCFEGECPTCWEGIFICMSCYSTSSKFFQRLKI